MGSAVSMRGYNAVVTKATNSLLRSAKWYMRKDSGHFEQWSV